MVIKNYVSFAALFCFLIVLLSGSFHHGCTKSDETHIQKATEEAAGSVYTCPMHPEVNSSKPGKCSKCGMDLVLEKNEPDSNKIH